MLIQCPAASFLLFGHFEGTDEGAFGAAFQFVADGPMIPPDQVVAAVDTRVHEQERALEIIAELFVGHLTAFCAIQAVNTAAGATDEKPHAGASYPG